MNNQAYMTPPREMSNSPVTDPKGRKTKWKSGKQKMNKFNKEVETKKEPEIKAEAENDSEESENFHKRHKHQIWLQQRKNHQN